MDEQDERDKNEDRDGLKFAELSAAILGCAFEVSNGLGAGFLESVYGKALAIALRQKGMNVVAQHPIKVMFRGECVGEFCADLFVDGKIIVELKAIKSLAGEHHAQMINYLKATGVEVGLLINFGNPKLEFRRFTRSKNSAD